MALIKTSGIVTREMKYGDNGKIVTLITHDLGKISAIASNVRTKKSGMLAGLQLFAYSEFVLFKGKGKKGLYSLNEVTLLESFDSIRTSLDKLAYASYFAEVTNHALGQGFIPRTQLWIWEAVSVSLNSAISLVSMGA